ncbi:DUF6319 family protein [Gordonia sp. p3-SID1431]|uniref:DUF6319 family protein n=1 Tax=Gordonia sp. p3-SID1431 TaxID=2916159 RepID=UPI0021A2803B|nr:DUF6319 family protein [Gordonia sp. p3-SID1431]MCT1356205.1 DUF6319 family protein [Gordonia sp. p3-SID1431]
MCDNGAVSSQTRAGLSPDDLESLSAALAAGKRATVYLRDAMPSLNLEAGASARVVSIDGSTVTVSPRGVDDQLPFEADELRRSRPAAVASTATTAARRRTPEPTPPRPQPTSSSKTVDEESTSARPSRKARPATDAPPRAAESAPAPATTSPSRKAKAPTAPTTVTITAAGESTWTLSVAVGTRKLAKPVEITADRVARAMRELDDETAIAAVDAVIESARTAAQRRIDELSQELEAARAALANLDGSVDDQRGLAR